MEYNFGRATHIFEVIDILRSTTSSVEKVIILKEAIAYVPHFKSVLEFTYDPYKQYHIKKIPEYNKASRFHLENYWKKFFMIFGFLSSRAITGNAAIERVSQYFDFLPGREKEVGELIFKRSLSCGVSATTINKAHPNLIPVFNVAKAKPFNEKNMDVMVYPLCGQEKIDAARCNVICEDGTISFRSSSGNVLKTYDGQLMNEIKEMRSRVTGDCVIDGELIGLTITGRDYLSRRVSNGLFNKAVKDTIEFEEFDKFVFIVWDIIPLKDFYCGVFKMPYSKRFELMKTTVNKDAKRVKLVETRMLDSFYQVQQFYLEVIEKGGEGLVLKNLDSIWKPKRLANHIKMKVEKECELRIVKVVEGVGKYEGKLGAFICESECGKLRVRVGSGFSDEQRDLYFTSAMKDSITTTKFNEIIEGHDNPDMKSLFLPIFAEVRDNEKTVANTLIEIQEIDDTKIEKRMS